MNSHEQSDTTVGKPLPPLLPSQRPSLEYCDVTEIVSKLQVIMNSLICIEIIKH